ncbi:MAG: HD family phosphohydrolase [Nitrospirales bacterium]|nr:MAG: HD family phosphohydrolase [Nitrospirales bacterium]
MSQKIISINDLILGMYVCGVDRPWMETPFLRHRFSITTQTQIDKLKQCGVKQLTIDLSRGIDAVRTPENTEGGDNVEEEHPAEDVPIVLNADEHQAKERISNLPTTLRGKSLSNELSSTRESRSEMLESVRDLLTSIATSGTIQAHQVKEVTHSIISQTLEHEDACIALIRTREFSADLHEHSLSVGTLAVLLGRLIGYDEAQLRILGTAALLHDVGLLRIPSSLLIANNRQSKVDQDLYNLHPQLSMEILKESSGISDQVREIIETHHVRLDGTGYPKQIAPDTMSTSSRLLRVVDEYDELLTGQLGLPPMSGKHALRELYQRGQQNQLDQQLVSQFISQVGIYPIYSLVELNTGERGIVTAHSKENLLYPTILLIQDATQHPYSDPVPINFATMQNSQSIPEIVKVLDPEQEGVRIEKVLTDWVTM